MAGNRELQPALVFMAVAINTKAEFTIHSKGKWSSARRERAMPRESIPLQTSAAFGDKNGAHASWRELTFLAPNGADGFEWELRIGHLLSRRARTRPWEIQDS